MKGQKAYIGKNSLISLKEELEILNPRKVFLVHGRRSYEECGASREISRILDNSSASEVFEFYDFSANPEFSDLQKALKDCEIFKPDMIMAVGGGSAIDIAKLVRFFHSYDGNVEKGCYIQKKDLVPLAAIPTTAGTGAEATHFAVLYKDKIKHSVEHYDVLPDYAIIYPPFTYNNPPYLTACTGFDALAQGIEAFWNRNATLESDEHAKKAIELLYPSLPLAVNSPAEEVRDRMAEGSYWAGRAINITKTTAPHAFSYGLTSIYGYPHGHAVALCFPILASLNLKNGKIPSNKVKFLYNLFNASNDCVKEKLEDYISGIGLINKGGNYSIDTLLKGINPQRLLNNPTNISDKEAEDLLVKILTW